MKCRVQRYVFISAYYAYLKVVFIKLLLNVDLTASVFIVSCRVLVQLASRPLNMRVIVLCLLEQAVGRFLPGTQGKTRASCTGKPIQVK